MCRIIRSFVALHTKLFENRGPSHRSLVTDSSTAALVSTSGGNTATMSLSNHTHAGCQSKPFYIAGTSGRTSRASCEKMKFHKPYHIL
eukprot:1189600-Prorocentrum_minimum.AAC.2